MSIRLIGALLALFLSASAWSETCPASLKLTDRPIPLAGEQWTALQKGEDPATASHMAMFPEETVHASKYRPAQKMANRGFDHLLGMWNAVTTYPCDRGRPALIEFESFEVVRLDPSSGRLIPELVLRFPVQSFAGGDHYKRQPMWFVSGLAGNAAGTARTDGKTFAFDLKGAPQNIVHMWTDRIKAVPGAVYGIRAKVRITGDARLQLAMDYWRGASSDYTGWSSDCIQPTDKGIAANNCEAWLGEWQGDTGGKFVTVISPRSLLPQ